MAAGMTVVSGDSVEPKVGNCMQLKNIPTGMAVHNIELYPDVGQRCVAVPEQVLS